MHPPAPLLRANRKPPESVLILKPSSLGDVVHTLPAVAALKRLWPETRFRWLVNPEWASILENNPCLEEILLFPRAQFRGPLGPIRLLSWARSFARSNAADLVLDFQCLLRSALIGKLTAKRGFYGLSDAREGAALFYDSTASVQKNQHAVDRYLTLAASMGANVTEPLEWPLPSAPAPAGFDLNTPYVVLHPFSRGAGKSMTPAQIEAFCVGLAPWRVVILGRSAEPVPKLAHVENWLNRTTLPELVTLMRKAAWVVSVDSGPMHIAAALSARLLAFHTWSDPQRVGPYRKNAWVWRNGRIFQRGNPGATNASPETASAAAWLKLQLAQPGLPE